MKIGDFVVVIFTVMCVVLLIKSCNERTALDECVEDISKKCASTISYAIALEDENARLNRLVGKCRENENR